MFFADFLGSTSGLNVNGNARIVENSAVPDHFELSDDVGQDLSVKGERQPERQVVVEVEEAYIHCAKPIALVKRLDKTIRWGTDDKTHGGGNYFRVRSSRRVPDGSASRGKSGRGQSSRQFFKCSSNHSSASFCACSRAWR